MFNERRVTIIINGRFRFIYNLCLFGTVLLLSIFLHHNIGSCSSDTPKSLTINSDMQYGYALDRFKQQDFPTAIVEFNRFIYFFPEDRRVKDATFKKGVSLFYTKRYGEAITIFKILSAPLFADIDSSIGNRWIAVESFFMLTNSLLAIKRDASAEMVLQDFLLLNDEPAGENRALYALVWIYLARAEKIQTPQKESLQALDKAIGYIDKMTPAGRKHYNAGSIKKDIAQTIEMMQQRSKSPLVAGISSIIPGGGFAYCNRYQDAFVSFLLNSAFVLAAIESFADGNVALGGLISFVGSGFYGGSVYGGIASSYKYNKEIIKSNIDDMRRNGDIDLNTGMNRDRDRDDKIVLLPYQHQPVIYDDDQPNKNGQKIPLISIKIPF